MEDLIGNVCVSIRKGLGSFLMMEFSTDKHNAVEGKFLLWVYCCDWFLDKDGHEYLSSEDNESYIAEKCQILKWATVNGYKSDELGTWIEFSDDTLLSMIPYEDSIDSERCILFKDGKYVASVV